MSRIYVITGANGHLASTIIKYLRNEECIIRGLILPTEANTDNLNEKYYKGDITKKETLEEIFTHDPEDEMYVIHAAGLISIQSEVTPAIYNVNVNGTKNVIELCKKYQVKRLLYVSSVHAIPEGQYMSIIREVHSFSKNDVSGAYACTKAEATQAVIEASEDGLDVVVVHPSGILGPFDDGHNHMTQLIQSYITGKLPAGVTGGYDFVDVRDVAQGCIAAIERGQSGECYILSNRYIPVSDLLEYMRIATNGRKKICFPLKLAKLAAPVFEWIGKVTHTRPLFTKYSLHTMDANGRFCHDKATIELGYSPRDMKETVADTIHYLETRTCRI